MSGFWDSRKGMKDFAIVSIDTKKVLKHVSIFHVRTTIRRYSALGIDSEEQVYYPCCNRLVDCSCGQYQ
jgi:hypothetical protein